VAIAAAAILLYSVNGGAARPQQEPSLPDGAGKDVFVSVCSLCHSPIAVTTKQWTEKQWDAKVTEMLQEEPDVTAEERAAIIAYLSANFKPLTKVNVNKATASELASALGLAVKDAEAIVRFRTEKGPFKTIDDLKRVSASEASAKLEAAKERLEF
jgi:competence ComEA-like helix-hairpin-helix protein